MNEGPLSHDGREEGSAKALDILFDRIDYHFNDPSLASLALTHRSYSNENNQTAPEHNERLEFLGDAVLDLVISHMLMERYPGMAEGELSKTRAGMVSEAALAEIAREIDLGAHLLMGRGEIRSRGYERDSILADALEALIAAVFLDAGGFGQVPVVAALVERLFGAHLHTGEPTLSLADFKTSLQERVQKQYKDTVRYVILKEEGPDHAKLFQAAVYLRDLELGRGEGTSKKQAEQDAARLALYELQQALERKQGKKRPTGRTIKE